mgnify:CR=1 FL=1
MGRRSWITGADGCRMSSTARTGGAADAGAWDLRPAMTLRSKIIGVQQLQPGDTVGYGSAFTAERVGSSALATDTSAPYASASATAASGCSSSTRSRTRIFATSTFGSPGRPPGSGADAKRRARASG